MRFFAARVSRNHLRTVWILKCDIRKFFANIDHEILKRILQKHILDQDILQLLAQIIDSFETEGKPGVGLPLGNLTSQLLVNIYMNELDQFLKRTLKTKYYIRYADDFVILHEDKTYLLELIPKISEFLHNDRHLELHPKKLFLKTLASGVDFLGWVHFPNHRVPRTSTKRRMLKKLKQDSSPQSIASYIGILKHGNAHKLTQRITVSKIQSIKQEQKF